MNYKNRPKDRLNGGFKLYFKKISPNCYLKEFQ